MVTKINKFKHVFNWNFFIIGRLKRLTGGPLELSVWYWSDHNRPRGYTQRNIFQNQTEIRLYLPYSDWFLEQQTDASVRFQINRKMVNTIWFRFDLIIFRKDFSVCGSSRAVIRGPLTDGQNKNFQTALVNKNYTQERPIQTTHCTLSKLTFLQS